MGQNMEMVPSKDRVDYHPNICYKVVYGVKEGVAAKFDEAGELVFLSNSGEPTQILKAAATLTAAPVGWFLVSTAFDISFLRHVERMNGRNCLAKCEVIVKLVYGFVDNDPSGFSRRDYSYNTSVEARRSFCNEQKAHEWAETEAPRIWVIQEWLKEVENQSQPNTEPLSSEEAMFLIANAITADRGNWDWVHENAAPLWSRFGQSKLGQMLWDKADDLELGGSNIGRQAARRWKETNREEKESLLNYLSTRE